MNQTGMISVQTVIQRLRRDLTLSALLKGLLIGAAVAGLLAGIDGIFILLALGAVWIIFGYRSAKGSRLAAQSSSLIAAGQFEQAERQIDQALRYFSLFRAVKLLSLHHLAVLRHAQQRWAESAILCQTLLAQRLGGLRHLSRSSRLILADALLRMGDLAGAHRAMGELYSDRLTLSEAMNLLSLQLDYQSRVGAWEEMLAGLDKKVQLAELMPTGSAARAQLALSVAARKCGRGAWADWLRRRVELLADVPALLAEQPHLAELTLDA